VVVGRRPEAVIDVECPQPLAADQSEQRVEKANGVGAARKHRHHGGIRRDEPRSLDCSRDFTCTGHLSYLKGSTLKKAARAPETGPEWMARPCTPGDAGVRSPPSRSSPASRSPERSPRSVQPPAARTTT